MAQDEIRNGDELVSNTMKKLSPSVGSETFQISAKRKREGELNCDNEIYSHVSKYTLLKNYSYVIKYTLLRNLREGVLFINISVSVRVIYLIQLHFKSSEM